jgi:hypothetical protein
MPYKDPERKRQWEREHREQRNARRRALRVTAQTVVTPKPVPDPPTSHQHTGGWKDIFGLAVGVGILMLAAFAGTNLPGTFIREVG